MRLLSGVVLWLAATTVGALEIHHATHCPWGCPSGGPVSNDLITRDIYILSSNATTKFADWVAYQVNPANFGPSRTRNWKADPLLAEEETLEPDDYQSAYAQLLTDRGHQAPLASFAGHPQWSETNYLSNVTPQKSALNQGPWKKLEEAVRRLATETGAVYVVTGPLYERAMPKLPGADEPHRVPSGYWKVVAIAGDGLPSVAAFVMDQETPRQVDLCASVTTIDDIEARSGLDLLHRLWPDEQMTIESVPGSLTLRLGCP